jgi:hypothetical protein
MDTICLNSYRVPIILRGPIRIRVMATAGPSDPLVDLSGAMLSPVAPSEGQDGRLPVNCKQTKGPIVPSKDAAPSTPPSNNDVTPSSASDSGAAGSATPPSFQEKKNVAESNDAADQVVKVVGAFTDQPNIPQQEDDTSIPPKPLEDAANASDIAPIREDFRISHSVNVAILWLRINIATGLGAFGQIGVELFRVSRNLLLFGSSLRAIALCRPAGPVLLFPAVPEAFCVMLGRLWIGIVRDTTVFCLLGAVWTSGISRSLSIVAFPETPPWLLLAFFRSLTMLGLIELPSRAVELNDAGGIPEWLVCDDVAMLSQLSTLPDPGGGQRQGEASKSNCPTTEHGRAAVPEPCGLCKPEFMPSPVKSGPQIVCRRPSQIPPRYWNEPLVRKDENA